MKILQILPELNAGGVERGTLEIARALVEAGHTSLVVSNGGRLVPELGAAGSRHIALPVHRKSIKSLLQVSRLRRVFEEEKPDVVHARSRVPAWLAWLALRGMDAKTRPHFVTTVHGFYSINFYSAIMTRGERIIAVSHCIRDYVTQNYPKAPVAAIRVIPRGVELAELPRGFMPDAAWLKTWTTTQPQLVGKAVLLLPGRITRLKGHEDFFAMIAGLKTVGFPVHGVVVGDTHAKKKAYMGELRAAVEGLGLKDDVTFLGHRGDIREIMTMSDIIYCLSVQPESFGRTTLEAFAIGKPVVGYNHGGVAEQLKELFPQGAVPLRDIAGLVSATTSILRTKAVPGMVAEPFTKEAMCAATLAVYRELVPAK
ncbi:MAG TPA: glycosyltransferase family 4 protein [Rariglobus sp.]|jgi:glycosyltransferase involved in cell wall biosynthesis|nr:glycosyltransferase family 4 protein [Rariglobus sp.]